jgi:hypothetical protein
MKTVRNMLYTAVRTSVVLVLVSSWIFSAWPQVFRFPPKIEEAKAASFLSEAHNDNVAVTTLQVTLTINAGETVVVIVSEALSTVSSITDTGGSSYTKMVDAVGDRETEIWTTLSAKASSAVTVNMNASANFNVDVLRYSGVSAFGRSATNSGNDTGPNISLATQGVNSLVVAGFGHDDPGTCSSFSGTARLSCWAYNQGSQYQTTVDKTAASPSSVSISFTTSNSTNWQAAALELLSAGGVTVSNRSDTLSDSRPSVTSNHSFAFTANAAISGSSTLVFSLPSGFTIPAGMDCGDVDAATSSPFNFNYPGCAATATAWGFTANGSVLTLQAPTGLVTPAFVQANAGECIASAVCNNATSVSFTSNNTAGNLIVVSSGWQVQSGTVTAAVSDSQGNLYATAVGPIVNLNGSFGPFWNQIWYAKNIKGGANTVTITYSSALTNAGADIEIHEYSGLDTISPLDVTASSVGISSSPTSGPATTNFANELIFGYADGENNLLSNGFSFNQREAINFDVSEDKIVGIAGAYSATFTDPGVNQWAATMATFKAAGRTYVKAKTPLSIYIGSNATTTPQGVHWITNPSTAGVYTIALGGTSGNAGNFLVAIGSGQTVAAQVAESLALTVSSVSAGVGFIQVASSSDENFSQTISATFNANNAVGNFIVLIVAWQSSGDSSPTIASDTEGNTYTEAAGAHRWSTAQAAGETILYAPNIKAGPNTVTVTLSTANSHKKLVVAEYSGINANSPLDVASAAEGQSTSVTSGSAVTTTNGELIIGGMVETDGASETISAGPNFNLRASTFITSTQIAEEDQIQQNAGSITATFTQSASFHWVASMATFKPATATPCSADDGATINPINTTASSVPFGTISANTFYQSCQDLVVSTNAGGGYSLTGQENHPMMTGNGGATIPDTTCDSGQCTSVSSGAWVTASKNGFGHTCADQVGHDCAGTYSSGTKFRPFANVAAGTGGIGFMQGNADKCAGACSSEAVIFTSNNTAGNLIVVGLAFDDVANFSSISDTNGNTYVQASPELTYPGGGAWKSDIYYAKNIKGGANTVTVNLSTNGHPEVYIHEYSGLDTASPLDVTASSTDFSANPDSGSATTYSANELIFGWGRIQNAGPVPGAGFTTRSTLNGNITEDKVVSVAGSYNATASANNGAWSMQMATFKSSALSGNVVMASSTPSIATGRVKYRLSVPTSQAAGTYTNIVDYILIGTY